MNSQPQNDIKSKIIYPFGIWQSALRSLSRTRAVRPELCSKCVGHEVRCQKDLIALSPNLFDSNWQLKSQKNCFWNYLYYASGIRVPYVFLEARVSSASNTLTVRLLYMLQCFLCWYLVVFIFNQHVCFPHHADMN